MAAVHEPWMMLDNWGSPIPAAPILDRKESRVVGLEEMRSLADGHRGLAELLTKYQDLDTIFWYDSPAADWAMGMGNAGYYLVRDGFLVDEVLMRMN